MAPSKNTELYEVAVDTWGSGAPVYPRGHILSSDTVAPGRDLEWAKRAGIVKALASDDPRRKNGPSPEPIGNPLIGDDGWSDPAFPYLAPVSRVESEQIAAATRAFEQGQVADAAGAAAADAAAVAEITANAAVDAKARAAAAAKAQDKALKVADKEGDVRPASAGDVQAATSPVQGAPAPAPTPPGQPVGPAVGPAGGAAPPAAAAASGDKS